MWLNCYIVELFLIWLNFIDGVIVSMLALSAVDRDIEPQESQTQGKE
jgi:hypothetical protein